MGTDRREAFPVGKPCLKMLTLLNVSLDLFNVDQCSSASFFLGAFLRMVNFCYSVCNFASQITNGMGPKSWLGFQPISLHSLIILQHSPTHLTIFTPPAAVSFPGAGMIPIGNCCNGPGTTKTVKKNNYSSEDGACQCQAGGRWGEPMGVVRLESWG